MIFNVKKLVRRTAGVFTAAALLSVSAFLFGMIYENRSALPIIKDASSAALSENGAADDAAEVISPFIDGKMYTVREYNGRVAVFGGGDEPEFTLDVFVFTLPAETAEMLRYGIECDCEGLSYLIDALTS